MSNSKELRREIVESGTPLMYRSLSQRVLGKDISAQEKIFGKPNDKIKRAQRHRSKFLEALFRQQLDRSLRHAIEGEATGEEVVYILDHIADFEKTLHTEGNCQVTMIELITSKEK